MTIPAALKTAMLNAQGFTHASLHSAFPGTSGANEITGGSPAYARQAIVMNAETGGQRTLSAAVVFNVPIGTVAWVGYWNGAAFIDCAPSGGNVPKNFVSVPAADRIYSTGHGWSDGQTVVFFGVPPVGLTEGVIYYVRDADTDSFKVAATLGGAPIDLTSAASAGSWVCAITPVVYDVQGTYQLTMSTFGIPD